MTSTPDVGRRPAQDGDLSRRDPQSVIAAEQIVLGAMMLAGTADEPQRDVESIIRIIEPHGAQVFYRPIHQTIYNTIIRLRRSGRLHGAIEVAYTLDAAELQRVGGAPYLHSLISAVPAVQNGPYHALAVRDEFLLREVQVLATRSAQIARGAATNEAGDTIDAIKRDWDALATPRRASTMQYWDAIAGDAVHTSLSLSKGEPDPRGTPISTGIPDLDQMLLGGFRPGQLILVGGRPGMGKTVFGAEMLQQIGLIQRQPFAWFSREMSSLEMGQRLLSSGARVLFEKIRTGTLDEEDWAYIARFLEDTEGAPVGIDDSPTITMPHVADGIAEFARRNGRIAGYGIDYAQIIDQTPETSKLVREQQVARIGGEAKLLARKHQCFAMLLAQLNREPDKRTDKRPVLTDLRESDKLVQDADIVILLHRDDYYEPESERAGELDLIVAKHRGGPTGVVTVAAQLHLQRLAPM